MAGEKVFVSSTWLDNAERRRRVEEAILNAEMIPVGMERFTASTEPTVEECLRLVREADVLVGIVAWRYGWIPPGEERSITELEYEAAGDRLMFQLDPEVLVHPVRDYDEGADKGEKLDKLSRFKKRFAEDQLPALFNEENLSLKVLKALQDWCERRQASGGMRAPLDAQPPDFEGELLEYSRRAESRHDNFPLAGFRTKLRVPIRLEELYVPLQAVVDLRGVGDATFADALDAEKKLSAAAESMELPANEAFVAAEKRGRNGLVLLGDPGSGKTTQLKRILLWLLRKGPAEMGLPVGMLPVFLPLRDLTEPGIGLESFIEATHAACSAGFGRRLLERGNLLFLLDGLDEVADAAARATVARWIDGMVVEYPDCRFMVSCRFAGYSEKTRLSERFLELHLRPLSARQAEKFVHNWYRIVETGLAKGGIEEAERLARDNARRLIDRLREPDFRARRVFELTRNPLLLANLCLVHRDRGQLPRRRAELYDECVDVLLERWRAGKNLEGTLTAKRGRRVLQPAAYWLHSEEGRKRATAAELEPVVGPALRAVRWRGGGAKEFLRLVRDESGLLTLWDQERYGFMHLGFQEYLAACEIHRLAFHDRSVLRELAGHHGESWWQEVALLLVALDQPSLFEPYLSEVVRQRAFANVPEALDALLEDAVEVSGRPFLELLERDPGRDEELCRLPSEAQWEYAARAGTEAPYLTGPTVADLERFGWDAKNSGGRLHPVGEKEPNEWGLHDVVGNVWEWVEDDSHGDYRGAPQDGSAWVKKPREGSRVRRGGSFNEGVRTSRIAYRGGFHPGYRFHRRGSRVVRVCSGVQITLRACRLVRPSRRVARVRALVRGHSPPAARGALVSVQPSIRVAVA